MPRNRPGQCIARPEWQRLAQICAARIHARVRGRPWPAFTYKCPPNRKDNNYSDQGLFGVGRRLSFASMGRGGHDARMRRIPYFLLLGSMLIPNGSEGESADEALARATAAVQAATPRAQSDPAHP